MDVDELIEGAWGAVKKAGVPESVQAIALKEAIDYLRDADGGGAGRPTAKRLQRKQTSRKPRGAGAGAAGNQGSTEEPPDEDAFFSQLADESGVAEVVLRDVLQLKGSVVHVIPATRKLGSSKAEQTRRVISLVGGAYAHGLGKSPVSADAVRNEAKKKRCFDTNNFAAVLSSLKGFSSGSSRAEIVVGSKWLGEFQEAVAAATGADAEAEEE